MGSDQIAKTSYSDRTSDQRGMHLEMQVMILPMKHAGVIPDPSRSLFTFSPCQHRGEGGGALDVNLFIEYRDTLIFETVADTISALMELPIRREIRQI